MCLKIEVKVIAAAWIEFRLASRTLALALQVLANAEFCSAAAAEDSFFLPFLPEPNFTRMISEGIMTVSAGVKHAATLHFDGHDISNGAPMCAACLSIQMHSSDLRTLLRGAHCILTISFLRI